VTNPRLRGQKSSFLCIEKPDDRDRREVFSSKICAVKDTFRNVPKPKTGIKTEKKIYEGNKPEDRFLNRTY